MIEHVQFNMLSSELKINLGNYCKWGSVWMEQLRRTTSVPVHLRNKVDLCLEMALIIAEDVHSPCVNRLGQRKMTITSQKEFDS